MVETPAVDCVDPARPYGPRVDLGGLSPCCGTISAPSERSSTTARDRGRDPIRPAGRVRAVREADRRLELLLA
jgi:hypothetical protein